MAAMGLEMAKAQCGNAMGESTDGWALAQSPLPHFQWALPPIRCPLP